MMDSQWDKFRASSFWFLFFVLFLRYRLGILIGTVDALGAKKRKGEKEEETEGIFYVV